MRIKDYLYDQREWAFETFFERLPEGLSEALIPSQTADTRKEQFLKPLRYTGGVIVLTGLVAVSPVAKPLESLYRNMQDNKRRVRNLLD
jgi:hypothetical protein